MPKFKYKAKIKIDRKTYKRVNEFLAERGMTFGDAIDELFEEALQFLMSSALGVESLEVEETEKKEEKVEKAEKKVAEKKSEAKVEEKEAEEKPEVKEEEKPAEAPAKKAPARRS